MLNLVPLLVAAALVSLHSASGSLLTNKLDTENTLQPNVVPTRRLIRKYVKIFKAPPETVRLIPGQRLELECQVIGSPTPAISWMKNGEPLVDYEEEANEILSVHQSSIARLTSKLVLNGAVDGDVYTCLGTSGVKQQSASSTVYTDDGDNTNILLEKLLVSPSPILTYFYNEIFQTIGTNLLLPCRVHGSAKVFWQDENENMLYDNARLRILPSGDLLIQSLRWSDMGQYTCTAHNEFGRDTAATFVYPVKSS